VYSALVVNSQCRLSHIVDDSGCFLDLAIRSDDNYVRVMASLVNEPEDIDRLEIYDPFD
jgi:hypothetical protein